MSARQEDPDVANEAGTGSDQGTSGGPAAEHGASEGGTAEDGASEDGASERGAGAAAKVRAWCIGRLPADWFPAPPDIQVDREEITIGGQAAHPVDQTASDAEAPAAAEGV